MDAQRQPQCSATRCTLHQGEHLFLADGTMNPNAILATLNNRNIARADDWKKGKYHNDSAEYNLSVTEARRMNYMVSARSSTTGCIQESDFKASHSASVEYKAKDCSKSAPT
ncbi:hypothetical protein [Muribaculum intestinale]|uniref:hypothetical protein n=1 Tax=Muribaculum intestinale TaxID=1796646 RepID=UPI003F6680E8